MLTGMCHSTFIGDLFAMGLTYPVTLISANFSLWHPPTGPHVMSIPGCAFVFWSLTHQSRLGSSVLSGKDAFSFAPSPLTSHTSQSPARMIVFLLFTSSSACDQECVTLHELFVWGRMALCSSQLLPELSIRQNTWQVLHKRSCVVPGNETQLPPNPFRLLACLDILKCIIISLINQF